MSQNNTADEVAAKEYVKNCKDELVAWQHERSFITGYTAALSTVPAWQEIDAEKV